MKLLKTTTIENCRLYSTENGGYTVAVFDQSRRMDFALNSDGTTKNVDFDDLSKINQDGIKWAQNQINLIQFNLFLVKNHKGLS